MSEITNNEEINNNIEDMVTFWQSKQEEEENAKAAQIAKEEKEKIEKQKRMEAAAKPLDDYVEALKAHEEKIKQQEKEADEAWNLIVNACQKNKPQTSNLITESPKPSRNFDQEADQILSSLKNQANSLEQQCNRLNNQIISNTPSNAKLMQLQLAKQQLDEIREMSWRQAFDKKRR